MFLDIYPSVRSHVMSPTTISSGFRATGIYPYDPDRVLQKLTFVKTPSPPGSFHGTGLSPWISETPKNSTDLAKQLDIVKECIARPSQSPTEPLTKLAKSAEVAMSVVPEIGPLNGASGLGLLRGPSFGPSVKLSFPTSYLRI
jgi:hypothetical protein